MTTADTSYTRLPLVSICVPTYNGAQFLQEALDSIRAQTYTELEIIISDDASTDGTLALCQAFKDISDYPVKILNHKPSGIAENWNNTMRHASGTYIKFLFQDDVLKPECIATMVRAMESHPQMALVCCKRDIIYTDFSRFVDGFVKNFKDLQVNLNLPKAPLTIISGKTLLKSEFFKLKPINIIGEPVAVLFKRDLIDTIGYFNNTMFQLVDYEYWLRIMRTNDIGFIQDSLVQFRLHETQASYLNNHDKQNDKDFYYQLLYTDYFWNLHSNFKWLLLKKHHRLVRFLIEVKAQFRNN